MFDRPEMKKTLNSHNSGTRRGPVILRAALDSRFHAEIIFIYKLWSPYLIHKYYE
jgi:hypothetical protein